jgi:hypothetical protein
MAQVSGVGALTHLRAPRPAVHWDQPERGSKDALTDRVWIGADPNGLGFEVAVAAWSGAGLPTQEALRTLHAARLRNRAIPLCVAVHDTQGRAWIFGPATTAPAGGIRTSDWHGGARRLLCPYAKQHDPRRPVCATSATSPASASNGTQPNVG